MFLTPIAPPAFNVSLDIRYATTNNFTGKLLYKKPACFLHPIAADALKKAIAIAAGAGLRLKIFDAFRPIEVQRALWQHSPNPEFLSNPETGNCPHCRGVAIDITLIDERNDELDMGTPFDAFTPLSHHGSVEIPMAARKNRLLLAGIMALSGWDFYAKEWWHYQLFKPRDYPILSDSEAGAGLL